MLTFLMKVCLKGVICLHNRDLFPEGFEDIMYHQQHTFYQSLMLPQNLPKPREILDQYKEEYANLRNHIMPFLDTIATWKAQLLLRYFFQNDEFE